MCERGISFSSSFHFKFKSIQFSLHLHVVYILQALFIYNIFVSFCISFTFRLAMIELKFDFACFPG